MEILDLLKTVHDEALNRVSHFRFDKKHPWHLHLLGLYGTLIELSSAIIVLINEKQSIGVPILFRTFLEAYVDFINLSGDRSYGNSMRAAYNDQLLKFLNEAKGNNPYLAGISNIPNLDEEIQSLSTELNELEQKGYRPLLIMERFKKANMIEEYRSLYSMMCAHSHNNIRAFVDRHIEISENDFKVVYYKDTPLESFLPVVDSTCVALINVSQKIHEILGTSQKEVFDQFEQQLNKIRKTYHSHN